MFNRGYILDLIQRSLGLRHKLKVHESMDQPETHEELSLSIYAQWELEDELRAIEELLSKARSERVDTKKTSIEKSGVHIKGRKPQLKENN